MQQGIKHIYMYIFEIPTEQQQIIISHWLSISQELHSTSKAHFYRIPTGSPWWPGQEASLDMLVVSSNLLRAVHTALLLKEGKSKVPRVSRAKKTFFLANGYDFYWHLYPMNPSTFLGSVWGIIYNKLEA